jgi:hypothetical protein
MATQESTAEIIRRLIGDLARLLQRYRQELGGHVGGLGRDIALAAAMMGAAAVLGIFALCLLVATLVLVLAIWLPAWLAALAVLIVIALVMGLLVAVPLRRLRRRRAVLAARVEEEVRWLRSLFPRES